MEPFDINKFDIAYKKDDNIISLLSEANQKYTEYKIKLSMFNFDPKFFLKSLIRKESLSSSRIEGTQVTNDEMYFVDYKLNENDAREVSNAEEMLNFAKLKISKSKRIKIEDVNKFHKILLTGTRGENKTPGELRDNQNWIGPKGCSIKDAEFIPPKPEDVPSNLKMLFDSMIDKSLYPDDFINIAISHALFETIHPYRDGNGRVGRALIPIQLSLLKKDEPLLFMSEIIELYKPSYAKALTNFREGKINEYLDFFLNCIIYQCNGFIYKINEVNEIYNSDYEFAKSNIKGSSIEKVFPALIKLIVFTKEELIEETGMHINTLDRLLNQLVELNILSKQRKEKKLLFTYKSIYDVFTK